MRLGYGRSTEGDVDICQKLQFLLEDHPAEDAWRIAEILGTVVGMTELLYQKETVGGTSLCFSRFLFGACLGLSRQLIPTGPILSRNPCATVTIHIHNTNQPVLRSTLQIELLALPANLQQGGAMRCFFVSVRHGKYRREISR